MYSPRNPIYIALLTMVFAAFCGDARGEDAAKTSANAPQARPMELTKLLSLLPACPDTWVMKRSQARTLYLEGMEAYAMREYKEFVLPKEKRAKDAPKPETVVMVIRDTCGQGPHIEPFREETAPTSGGDFELGKWNRFPAMLVRMGNKRKALRILVADRFVVEVVYSGNNLRALKWWLERCKLKTLSQAKQRIPLVINEHVKLRFLDELHPERTRSYSVPIEPGESAGKNVIPNPEKPQKIVSE